MKMYTIWSNEYDVIENLDDERANLNIEVGEEIIIIADLGLWDGRHQAYKLLRSTNIADCLTGTVGDYVTWFVDDRGDLMCRDCHHDGTTKRRRETSSKKYTVERQLEKTLQDVRNVSAIGLRTCTDGKCGCNEYTAFFEL